MITIIDTRLLAFLTVVFVFLILNYLKKQNDNRKVDYQKFISELGFESFGVFENSKAITLIDDFVEDQKIFIPESTINGLLIKLEEFEKAHKYIDQNMSLSTLSSMLNTNSKYLSEIIKKRKKKKFRNYINGLRINYITNLLLNKPEYREYKISYLAECSGFSSRVVFAVVFKKERGISPSSFIENLKK